MTVDWLAFLALGPQLRLSAQQSPGSMVLMTHAQRLECSGGCQAQRGGSAARVQMASWSLSDPGASEKAGFAAGNTVSTPEAAL